MKNFKIVIKKIFKWIGIALGVLIVIVLAVYAKAYFSVQNRLNKKYEVARESFELQSDSSILVMGERYTQICKDCHGSDFGGKVWIDDPLLGRLVTANLTRGKGGLPADYSVEDWLLALRHGLKKDMTPLIVMPAQETNPRSQEDLNAIIAFLSQVPAVDNDLPKSKLRPLGYFLTDIDKLSLMPAEKIDHAQPMTRSVKREVSVEFGKYLAVTCEGCHRSNMKGGPPLAPGYPYIVDISSTGNVGKWTEDQFVNTIRTGNTPEGKQLDPAKMPWSAFKDYSDIELKALFKFLQSMK